MPDFQAQTEVREDDPLEARRVAAVLAAVEAGDAARLTDLLAPLHAADIADLLEQMGTGDRHALLHLWSGEIDGEILSEIDESIREEVIDHLPRDVLHQAVRELDTDD
ncbi:MAG: magnesium transporter, partial [Pseudorhodobacter sp.]|nr:magnesium transporter [Pseudorhodobacter sp.]